MKEQERGNTILVAILAVALLAGAFVYLSGDEDTSTQATNTASESAVAVDDAMEDEVDEVADSAVAVAPAAEEKEMTDDVMVKEEAPAAAPLASGTFTKYSDDKLALADDGDLFVFFSADWCSKCQALEKDLNDNLSSIPGDVHILEANFDNDTDLKVKYGVNKQHTIVQVDSAGNEVRKLPGGLLTLDSILAAR